VNNDFEQDSAEWVSSHSWRTKFYGLIHEGHKQRVSPLALKVFVCCLATIAAALQIFSGVNDSATKMSISIEGPRISFGGPDANLKIPAFDPKKQQNQINEQQRLLNRQSSPAIKRLQAIKLSSMRGVPTGTEALAILSSGGTNGTVVARLKDSVIVDSEVVLPARTVLFGQGTSSDERLFIRFKKAILPDKSEQEIQAQVFDSKDRMVGLKGKKVSDMAFKIATSSGLIFLGGLADGLKSNNSVNIFGPQAKPSVRDAALNGVGVATSEQGKQMLESMRNEQARIEVKAETPVIVIFGNDTND